MGNKDLGQPVALIIDHRGGIMGGAAPRTQLLFNTAKDAEAAFCVVRDAAAAYHSRLNDREKMVTLAPVSGPASVDVTDIVVVFVDDVLGEGREALVAWNMGLAEIKAQEGVAPQDIAQGDQR